MSDIVLKRNYMKATEYAAAYNLPVQRVRQMCERGELDAYREGPGGHWYIRDKPADTVPRAEYEELVRENSALKTKLQAIMSLCGGI